MGKMWNIEFGWKNNAGLVCLWNADEKQLSTFAIHFLVSPRFWLFGRQEEWFDGPLYSFGLGPLILINWMEI
ncbi:MAG TPA: hypothetical protein VIE65_08740 [Methylobacter sp.]|jgi:hypothetical protein